MRWSNSVVKSPKDGDKRTKRKFLIIPRCIQNLWRVFEYAEWEQEYRVYRLNHGGKPMGSWVDRKWTDIDAEEIHEQNLSELKRDL